MKLVTRAAPMAGSAAVGSTSAVNEVAGIVIILLAARNGGRVGGRVGVEGGKVVIIGNG